MRSRILLHVGLVVALSGAASEVLCAREAHAEARYTATGRVVSFARDRSAVFIAHDAIPGVMGAMTMSFTARAAAQLTGVAVGDRVRFSFTVTDDGRRMLDSVQRSP